MKFEAALWHSFLCGLLGYLERKMEFLRENAGSESEAIASIRNRIAWLISSLPDFSGVTVSDVERLWT